MGHIKSILNKADKAIGLLRKFQLILPGHSLITIYKTLIKERNIRSGL